MFKKIICAVLSMSLFVSSASVWNFYAYQTDDQSEESIYQLLDQYFEARSSLDVAAIYDLDDIISIAIIFDEVSRMSIISESDIQSLDSEYDIDSINLWDNFGVMYVTETITYHTSCDSFVNNVLHEMYYIIDESDNSYIITRDAYSEDAIDFVSCEYAVDYSSVSTFSNGNAENDHVNTGDLAYDIAQIAITQIGYLEKASNSDLYSKTGNAGSANYTKYGDWYTSMRNWNNYSLAWCVVFANWCMYQAGITVEKLNDTEYYKIAGVDALKIEFSDNYIYNDSIASGGTYVPMMGDIFFASGHVGVVVDVSGTSVTVVDGNYSHRVSCRTYSADDQYFLGFGSLDYEDLRTNHDYESDSTDHSGTRHTCAYCNKTISVESWATVSSYHYCTICLYTGNHDYVCDSSSHSTTLARTCSVCGDTVTATYQVDYDASSHWKVCSLCGVSYDNASHTWQGDHSGLAHGCSQCDAEVVFRGTYSHNVSSHWKVCSLCGGSYDNASHTWVEVTSGYRCTVCRGVYSYIQLNNCPDKHLID